MSAGIIPLSKDSGEWKIFLVSHHGYENYWSSPKGHVEPGESHQEAASRELKEETNLEVERFLHINPIVEEFTFVLRGKSVHKRILYFVALVKGNVIIQETELAGGGWFSLHDAMEKTIHPEGKVTLQQVQAILNHLTDID